MADFLRNQSSRYGALACVLIAGAAQAQFRASIQGTVTDQTGAVVPGATLVLTDADTGRSATATSNASGTYAFNELAPDHYSLKATAPGFKEQLLSNLRLNPEQANAFNVQLQLGETTTTVTVQGDQLPQLETATASISGTVTSDQIQHLPSAGRDVFQLAQLAPGVFGDASQAAAGGTNNLPGTTGPGGTSATGGIFQTENGPQANANGQQNETNGIQIDGISTVSAVWGGTSVITPTEDSVGSVKVLSNAYDASNGRFSGAQIQVTSKTGTNQVHGSLFFRANRPGLNAYQRYNGPASLGPGTPSQRGLLRDSADFNQFGGSIGGPLWKNRLFAFFAYETERNHSTLPGTGWYETPQFQGLAPSGSIAATLLQFPGSTVASAGIVSNATCVTAGLVEGVNCRTIAGQGLNIGSPLTTGLGTQDLSYLTPSSPGVGSGLANTPDIAEYTTENPTQITDSQYNGRIDADVTGKDHVAFAIYWVPETTSNYSGSVRPYNLFHHDQTNDAFTVIYNHTFSATFLNEARANAAGYRYNEITSNPQEPFGLPQDTVSQIGSINLANFGAPGPGDYDQWTYTYSDVATKVLGNHNVRFGGEATRLYYLNNPTYSARPSYTFYNVWDLLNDAPDTESGSFDPLTGVPTTNRQDDREDLYGFFVQDDWKARPNLTLNLGLRYSYFGSLSSKENNLSTVMFGFGMNAFTGLSVREGGNLYRPQKGDFGPQFGFAYTPVLLRGKGVVRGGFGLNFNQEEIAIAGNTASNAPSVISPNFSSASPAAINPDILYTVGSTPTTLFGYPANPHTITSFNTANLPLSGGVNLVALPTTLPTPYSEHFSLDTEYQLTYGFVASVGYQGSVSRHTILQQNAYVSAVANGQAFNPLVNSVDFFYNEGSGNNNSLLVGLRHEMAHHFQFDAEFNYAKSMDTGSTPYYEDPYPYASRFAYGRSDYNVGKALKLNGLWQPVFFKGHGWLHNVGDGWSLSGIYNVHTGFPYSPVYNTGSNLYYANSGYSQLRPAAYLGGAGHNTSNAAFESGPQVGNGINANFPNGGLAYFSVPAYTPGAGLPQAPGVARNSLTGPGYQDLDATVTKAFGLGRIRGLGEGAVLEIRADAFNLFNETNLSTSSVSNVITSSNFGQAQSALGARVVNLQARFSF